MLLQIGAGLPGCADPLASRASLGILCSVAHMAIAMLSLPRVSLFSGNIANFSNACSKDCVYFSAPVHATFASKEETKSTLCIFSGMVIIIAFVLLWGSGSWRWYVSRHQLFMTIDKPHIFLNCLCRILSLDKIPSQLNFSLLAVKCCWSFICRLWCEFRPLNGYLNVET